MAVELATLEVKVNAAQAAKDTQALGKAMDNTAVSAEVLEKRAASLARMNARLAATSHQSTQAFALGLAGQAAATRGFTATAAATTRMVQVMAGLAPTTVAAGTAARTAATVISGAFGPGSVAALAIGGFITSMVRNLIAGRKEMDSTADKWEETVRRLLNAGDIEALKKQAQDLFLGTPAEDFKDGIVAAREEVAKLKAELTKDVAANLGGVFGGASKQLAAAEERLRTFTERFNTLQSRIQSTQNGLFFRSGPLPITSTATGPSFQTEREAFEESRRRADLRRQWENEEIDRLFRLEQARKRAALAEGRMILGLPDPLTGTPNFTGRIDSTLLPRGFDPRRGVTGTNGLRSTLALGGSDSRTVFDAQQSASQAFAINLQRSVGDGIARGFTEGLRSARSFFESVRDLGAGILGNVLGDRLTSGLTEKLSGLSNLQLGIAGGALGLLGGAISSLFGGGDSELKKFRDAVREAGQGVTEFAKRANRSTLTGEDARLADLQDERQRLARGIIGASRFRNNSQEFGSNFEADLAEFIRRRNAIAIGPANVNERADADQVIAELRRLQEAFAANLAAAQRASFGATADSLKAFGGSLSLSQFSPLSPTEQLREARSQYQTLLARALGGDQQAAEQFQSSAQQLLGLSRSVNASGGRFVADFNTVTQDTARLEALFRDRATVAEATRDAAENTATNTARGNEIMGGGFGGTIETLGEILVEMRELTRLQREGVA